MKYGKELMSNSMKLGINDIDFNLSKVKGVEKMRFNTIFENQVDIEVKNEPDSDRILIAYSINGLLINTIPSEKSEFEKKLIEVDVEIYIKTLKDYTDHFISDKEEVTDKYLDYINYEHSIYDYLTNRSKEDISSDLNYFKEGIIRDRKANEEDIPDINMYD